MTDEILKYIDVTLDEYSAKNETPETGCRYDKDRKLPKELHLEALRVAVEYISDIPNWHLLMTMPPKSPKNIKLAEIAAILGVEVGK